MKITIEIGDDILQKIVDDAADNDIEVTIAELKKNPNLAEWFRTDIDTVYFENFEEGLGDCCIAEDLELE